MKDKQNTKQKYKHPVKDKIIVKHEPDLAEKKFQDVISREKKNHFKITFFKKLFDGENPEKFYDNYVKRLAKWHASQDDILQKLMACQVRLEQNITKCEEEQEALLPDKLAGKAKAGHILLSAKETVEKVIASPNYQYYEKYKQRFTKALELTISRINSLSAELRQHEMANQANGYQPVTIYSP